MYIYLFYFVENGSKKLIFRKIPKALQEIISNTKKGTQGDSRELKGTIETKN